MNLWLMVAAVAISFIGATIAAHMLGIPVESDEVPAVKEKEQPVSSEMIRSTALKSGSGRRSGPPTKSTT